MVHNPNTFEGRLAMIIQAYNADYLGFHQAFVLICELRKEFSK
jgi:hypothetical protein